MVRISNDLKTTEKGSHAEAGKALQQELEASRGTADAAGLTLERRADGQLWAHVDGSASPVRVHRCFPWSEPGRFLSLRDDDHQELALVHGLDDLDDGSRRVLEGAIAEAGFVLEVTRIMDVDEEVEIRTWEVETRQGPRSFQTRLDDWPTEVPGGGMVIRDVAGDLYHVADPEGMDPQSRRWLWAFVD
ncbi:MAG: DUF1854 domain-containing protein [Longimicrobiales bacterium]|nr:DUF1854 domain-containing protein [Longimicrobiales bacterium]